MHLPVFIISFNRGRSLLRTIAGIERMDTEIEVIVHDNGSDDPETLEILRRLKSDGVSVEMRGKIVNADDLNNTNETVQKYFRNRRSIPYIVTDCDIDLACADKNAVSIYCELLERFPAIECVGPMLRIFDIPKSYPLYFHAMNRHIEQFWSKHPSWCDTSAGKIAYQFAPIDTTLAIHRSGQPFRRLKKGIRVYEPYEALHLDWYSTTSVADVYNLTSNQAISHWNNVSEFSIHSKEKLAHGHYYIVERTELGILTEKKVELA